MCVSVCRMQRTKNVYGWITVLSFHYDKYLTSVLSCPAIPRDSVAEEWKEATLFPGYHRRSRTWWQEMYVLIPSIESIVCWTWSKPRYFPKVVDLSNSASVLWNLSLYPVCSTRGGAGSTSKNSSQFQFFQMKNHAILWFSLLIIFKN